MDSRAAWKDSSWAGIGYGLVLAREEEGRKGAATMHLPRRGDSFDGAKEAPAKTVHDSRMSSDVEQKSSTLDQRDVACQIAIAIFRPNTLREYFDQPNALNLVFGT
jgi:hypothetical protein